MAKNVCRFLERTELAHRGDVSPLLDIPALYNGTPADITRHDSEEPTQAEDVAGAIPGPPHQKSEQPVPNLFGFRNCRFMSGAFERGEENHICVSGHPLSILLEMTQGGGVYGILFAIPS